MANETLSPEAIPTKAKSKRAVIYTRVSTIDQHPETQLYDLREMAKQRGYEIVHEYSDKISGAKQKRPGLDQLLADARRTSSTSCSSGPSIGWLDRCGISSKSSMNSIIWASNSSASARISTPEVRWVGQ